MRDMGEDQARVPLKTILQNFLNHVDSLEARKRARDDAYEQEFQSLKSFSDALKQLPEYSCSEGEKDVNRKKNRYKDILPFDSTRVPLSDYPGVPGSDYINANYIKGASGSNAYIASQGPLPNTVNDFWRMVIECEVQVIVMACNEQEAGKYKCENYWNEDESEEKQFGKFFVKLLKSREICPDFLVRTMRLRWTADGGKGEEERTVCQFHYSAWPDHGVPTQVKPLLEMVRLIRDCQASETLPVLVHCSAGCGRTGTICAIDFIWGLLRTGKLTEDFSLHELVRDMRRQRIAMVQTVEQYVLVHRAVRELFQEQLRVIDSHPYENVDGDGRPLCHTEDEIAPDYETIFVKQSDDKDQVKNAGDIDVILSERMKQRKFSEGPSSSPPPQPPPKQRTPIETSAIDSRQVTMSSNEDDGTRDESVTSNKETLFLYDPPTTNGDAAAGMAMKIKKGDLRLTQMENGSWRLEDNEKAAPVQTGITSAPTKPSSKKKKKDKDSSNDDNSNSDMLLRRPSIKKIRALFQKDSNKDKVEAAAESEENPEVLAAMSKLPKFEPLLRSESVSMPNSLDRRVSHQHQTSAATTLKVLTSSENKPNLPVKRSKSMKAISKPVSFLFSGNSSSANVAVQPSIATTTHNNDNDQNVQPLSDLADHMSRSDTFPKNSSTSVFDFENLGNLPRRDSGKDLSGQAEVGPPKPMRSLSEYSNLGRTDYTTSDFVSADTVRNRISNYVSSKPQTNAPNTLNDDAKKMLKDCQDYLISSFETAEREGERLLRSCATIATLKNRSAESSPMTTLQKTASARQLFSSHSSPSNSYNKYSNTNPGGKVLGTIQKSVSSPTGSIQNNFCSPVTKPVAEETSLPPTVVDDLVRSSQHNYENVIVASEDDYANLTIEAQRKLSAASVHPISTRERSNSFREAVQGSVPSRKPSYEPIWFAGDQESSNSAIYANAAAVLAAQSCRGLPREATQTERERMGEEGELADYESIIVNSDGRMVPVKKVSKESLPLQSVSLVSEVIQSQQHKATKEDVSPNPKPGLRKQCSNSSLHSSGSAGGGAKGPPPPYKQPPPPPSAFGSNVGSNQKPAPTLDMSPGTYANVQIHHHESSYISTSKDDSVLTRHVERRPIKTRSASQIVNNRLSCGDFTNQSFLVSSLNGLTVKSATDSQASSSDKRITSLPGIDLDAVAAMMQGGSSRASTNSRSSSNGMGGGQVSNQPPPRAFGRTLAGVISGAAANIRSRFAILGQSGAGSSGDNSLPTTLPSMMTSLPPIVTPLPPPPYQGEQLPSSLPLTVPGAIESSGSNQSFPSSFPQRLDHRPLGPREPPSHFQRKQEYL